MLEGKGLNFLKRVNRTPLSPLFLGGPGPEKPAEDDDHAEDAAGGTDDRSLGGDAIRSSRRLHGSSPEMWMATDDIPAVESRAATRRRRSPDGVQETDLMERIRNDG